MTRLDDPPVAAGALRPVVRLPRSRAATMRIALPALPSLGSPDALAIAAITLFLTGFGLLMVLSASSVEEGASGDPFGSFTTQGLIAFAGVGAMLAVGTRLPATVLPRIALPVFAGAIVAQLIAAFTGTAVGGNRNWIRVAGFSVQPSEFVKLGLVLVLAAFFTNRPGERLGLKRLVPVLVLSAIAIASVYAGHDLGTCLILGLIVAAALWFGGVRLPVLILPGLVIVFLFWRLAQADGSRLDRLSAWSQGCTDPLGTCWQTQQAEWALANGGLLGVGIGNSVSKWFWLPEADNDFIGAVIGEETGLLGLAVVLLCFVALAVVLIRLAARTRDRFVRTASGMALAWIVGQAFANLAVVVGLLPVFGVPLPFVSAGGSALLANLLLIGCLMSLANGSERGEPASTGAVFGAVLARFRKAPVAPPAPVRLPTGHPAGRDWPVAP